MFGILRIPLFLLLVAVGLAPASAAEEQKESLHPLDMPAGSCSGGVFDGQAATPIRFPAQ